MKRVNVSLWTALVGLMGAAPARATPAQVVMIRHAEKPAKGRDLDARGEERARALVGFFETNPVVTRYGTPAAIYAAAPADSNDSRRSVETVTPLAKSLGLEIDEDYTKDRVKEMVRNVMANPAYEGRTVLICWEHKRIPGMARQFGWASAPGKWSGKVFDRAWIIDFAGGRAVSFQDVPQRLLPGDSSGE